MAKPTRVMVTEKVNSLLADHRFDEVDSLLREQSDEPWVQALRGDLEYERENLPLAVKHYGLAFVGGVDDVILRLGNIQADLGDIAAAEHYYRQAAERGEVVAWRNLALAIEDTEPERAERYYARAWDLGDVRSGLLLGELLIDCGRGGEAVRILEETLSAGEGDAAITLGFWLREQERFDESESVLRRGLATDAAGDVVPYLGALLVDRGRRDEAVDLYRASLADDPDNAEVLLNLGNLLSGEGESGTFGEAEALYRRAIDLGSVEAFNNLGVLLRDLERFDEAKSAFEAGARRGDELAAKGLSSLRRRSQDRGHSDS